MFLLYMSYSPPYETWELNKPNILNTVWGKEWRDKTTIDRQIGGEQKRGRGGRWERERQHSSACPPGGEKIQPPPSPLSAREKKWMATRWQRHDVSHIFTEVWSWLKILVQPNKWKLHWHHHIPTLFNPKIHPGAERNSATQTEESMRQNINPLSHQS